MWGRRGCVQSCAGDLWCAQGLLSGVVPEGTLYLPLWIDQGRFEKQGSVVFSLYCGHAGANGIKRPLKKYVSCKALHYCFVK